MYLNPNDNYDIWIMYFRIRQSDKNGSNVSCRPTKVSLLISYVIPVCTWIILCKPNPGFWCSFQTSAWTIFFSWKLMKVRSITCIYRQLIMIWPCSRGHIIILDYPIIKCVKIPKFQVVNPLQISSTVGLILENNAPEVTDCNLQSKIRNLQPV